MTQDLFAAFCTPVLIAVVPKRACEIINDHRRHDLQNTHHRAVRQFRLTRIPSNVSPASLPPQTNPDLAINLIWSFSKSELAAEVSQTWLFIVKLRKSKTFSFPTCPVITLLLIFSEGWKALDLKNWSLLYSTKPILLASLSVSGTAEREMVGCSPMCTFTHHTEWYQSANCLVKQRKFKKNHWVWGGNSGPPVLQNALPFLSLTLIWTSMGSWSLGGSKVLFIFILLADKVSEVSPEGWFPLFKAVNETFWMVC